MKAKRVKYFSEIETDSICYYKNEQTGQMSGMVELTDDKGRVIVIESGIASTFNELMDHDYIADVVKVSPSLISNKNS